MRFRSSRAADWGSGEATMALTTAMPESFAWGCVDEEV